MMTKKKTKAKVPARDFAELLKPYSSGWVALTPDETKVVGAGETLQEALERAKKEGYLEPVFLKVIPPDYGYIPLL